MMDGDNYTGVPGSFWVIGAVTLIWNLAGAVNFVAQSDPEILAAYRESERLLVASRPGWATVAFALAVFVGTLGSVALLLRKSVAVPLFVVSFAGVAGTTIYSLFSGIDFSAGEVMGIVLMPLVVAGFLIWYSGFVARQGWLN